jgi:GT2 family glycosyltransferase
VLKLKSRSIEIYYDEEQVIERINQLKQLDYDDDDMYIIVNNSEDYDIEELEEITDVEVKDEETTLDAFKNLITGRDSLLDIFDELDLNKEDRDFYYKSLENEDILLYIDQEYRSVEEIENIEREPYPEELFYDIDVDEDEIEEESEDEDIY